MGLTDEQQRDFERAIQQAAMRSQPDLDLLAMTSIQDASRSGFKCTLLCAGTLAQLECYGDELHQMMCAELGKRRDAGKWMDSNFEWHNGVPPFTPQEIEARLQEIQDKHSN